MNERLPYLREKCRLLPDEPGVYMMRDQTGKIIYVGKAKILRNRVSSYFRSIEKHLPKVYRMVQHVHDFQTIVTTNEFEALVLECSLIKQHKPKYNILLKDDKGYHYIRVSDEPYPRITAVMQRQPDDKSRFFGPYTSSFVVRQTVDEVVKAFMLPTCSRKFPEDFRKSRPCLNYHIHQCIGVCTGKISQAEYNELVEEAVDFIAGGSRNTLELLTRRMQDASDAMDFEKAAQLRDRIRAMERINEKQNVVFARVPNQDVIAIAQSAEESCAVVLKFREQRLVDKKDFALGEIAGLAEARSDFILSYYDQSKDIPRQITLDGECEDQELIASYLSQKLGQKVVLHIPERGDQVRLVEMARTNASQTLAFRSGRTGREVAALDELARLLGLEQPPVYIEAYDISNMGEDTVVGGMVVFENGRPLKSAYRKFNIKTVVGTDDYGAMREVLHRRLRNYWEQKDTGEGFGRLPDLILLDGGRGHVSAIAPLLEDEGLNIPLFGMVKNDKHRTRAISGDGGEISILSSRSAFTLVSKIQDEVHRFSIQHMKSRHTKNAFTMQLTQVKGIGEKRARSLFRHFKTQKAMRAATVEELAAAPGMNQTVAQALYNFLREPQS